MRIATLLDLVFPPACACCGLPGADLCATCDGALARRAGPECARCGHPWSIAVDTCPECPPKIDRVRHALHYTPAAQSLVLALKEGGRRRLAELLADLIVATVSAPAACLLVPVPSTPAALRARGFNQAALVARALGRRWDLPVECVLVRGDGPRQRGASATDRRVQVRGAFHASPRTDWSPVTLVDDVMTTGSTLAACARALHAAGARRVGAVVVARACRHAPIVAASLTTAGRGATMDSSRTSRR